MNGYKEMAIKIGSVVLITVVVTALLLWAMLLLPIFKATTDVALVAANSSTYASNYHFYIGGLKAIPLFMVCVLPVGAGLYWIWQILRSPVK